MYYEVAVLSIPSVVAQQNGAVPKELIPLKPVVAQSVNAAVLLVGRDNAAALKDASGANLEVIVRQVK